MRARRAEARRSPDRGICSRSLVELTAAGAIWETQVAVVLRVGGFQSAVVSESQYWPTEWHISTLIDGT
jgi:hypothetical protein